MCTLMASIAYSTELLLRSLLGESIYRTHLGKDDLQVKRCSHPDLMDLMSKNDNNIQSTKAYHTLNASKT